MKTEGIFVFGASGHAKVVLDAARMRGRNVVAIFDDNTALHGQEFMGLKVLGGLDEVQRWCAANDVKQGIVAVGDNKLRADIASKLSQTGLQLTPVIHPQAVVADSVQIGTGSLVLAGAVLNPDAIIGRNVIINTATSVDHDCLIADHVHLAPGCRVCGHVSIGEGSLLGAGAVVIPGTRVGRNVIVGAGSAVLQDVPDNVRVAGSPARIIGEPNG